MKLVRREGCVLSDGQNTNPYNVYKSLTELVEVKAKRSSIFTDDILRQISTVDSNGGFPTDSTSGKSHSGDKRSMTGLCHLMKGA